MQEPYNTCHIHIQGRKEAKYGRGGAPDEEKDKGIWVISKEHPETFCKDYKEDCAQIQVQGLRTHLPDKGYEIEEARSTSSIGVDND